MKKCTIKGRIKLVVNKGDIRELPYEKKGKMKETIFYPDPYKSIKFYNTTDCTGTFRQAQENIILVEDIKYTGRAKK